MLSQICSTVVITQMQSTSEETKTWRNKNKKKWKTLRVFFKHEVKKKFLELSKLNIRMKLENHDLKNINFWKHI